jgi:tRNA threonylcarbamoyladenosine biosynthesis protein TsaB
MILLAIDTSGKDGSIALARVDEAMRSADALQILDQIALEGGTFSAQLVPQIAALLAKHGKRKDDMGAFAVASGPGSFTGLRVGLAAIKALAEILNKPIAAVSRLEAVARGGKFRGRVLAALDAGRNEIYVGEYDLTDGTQAIGERLVARQEFLNQAREWKVMTPDRSITEAARTAGFEVEEVERPTSIAIARIGWEKVLSASTISPEDLEANYIRRSDAEIFAKSP